jgi:MoaA/NifB/PqqE/SkfB family radical SAM enzyme
MIVVWRVTERCNLACGFCAYDRRLEIPRRSADPQKVLALGAELARLRGGSPVMVSWLGGEPLLWEPLQGLNDVFRRDYGFALSTTTNGTPLRSAAVRTYLVEHYAELTVSVDALGDRHDALRGCSGLFEQVRRAVRALESERVRAGASLKLRANVVLMRQTVDAFPALCRELLTWGIREISFNALGGRDRPEFYPEHALLPAQAVALRESIPALRAELAPGGVRLLGSDAYLERLVATSEGRNLRVEDCHPGESFLFIDERGRVSPCSFTSDTYGTDLLSTETSLAGVGACFRRLRSRALAPACEDCMSTHVFAKFTA